MKYTQKQSRFSKKPLLIASLVIFVLASGGIALHLKNRARSENNGSQTPKEALNFSPPTDAEKQQVEENKTKDGGVADSNQTSAPASNKSAKVSRAEFDDASKQLVVQTQLSGTGWQMCTLELTQGTQKITKTADTLYQRDFSTCMGFGIGASEFPAGGSWSLKLAVTNTDGKTYTSQQQNVTITK